MLYTPPRSTFHQALMYGVLVPIASVLIQVDVSLSIALLATKYGPARNGDWEVATLKERSSVERDTFKHLLTFSFITF